MAMYLPAWQSCCKSKYLPPNWRNTPQDTTPTLNDDNDADGTPEEASTNGEKVSDEKHATSHKDEPEGEQAVCYGHILDKRGQVHMQLRWHNTGDESLGEVRKIMGDNFERKTLGKTWLEYCDKKGFTNLLFRMKGVSVVKSIKGHEWAQCGRTVACIEWDHGEETKGMVKDTMELNTDKNAFKMAWSTYCDSIGQTDEAFQKGHANKEKRSKINKKRSRS